MKPTARHTSRLLAAALALSATSLFAGTTTTTFSFQQGDLRRDGALFAPGESYTGVVDGQLTDDTATSALTTTATSLIGNLFRSQTTPPAANGQNFISFYSYDLTALSDFITANTSANSSASITAVSFKLVAAGATAGTVNGAISLFRTAPFSSSANWSTIDGTVAWSTPYQTGLAETQYRFTGGGAALTSSLAGTSPSTANQSAGSTLQWTSSPNFIAALNHALVQTDKRLNLMAARPLQNSDGRVSLHSSNAATVDERPELVVTVSISSQSNWTGATSTSWATASNWTTPPTTGDSVRFNSASTANLATVLNQNFSLNSITVADPTGPVSIGGTNTLTLGAGGLDLSAAAQNLSVSAPIILGDAQTWSVAADRSLTVSSAITGTGNLTIFGAGKVNLGAANILPTSTGSLNVSSTLNLNGFSQTVTSLAGNGAIENTSGSATLNIDIPTNFSYAGSINDNGGTLAVTKNGTGNLTLTGASTFSGGFTNNGTGNVAPNASGAFGTGPVVWNGGTIYGTNTAVFPNTLTLNNATLRIGGGNSRTITWNGPVTATGTSGMSTDGGAGGVTLGNTLDITGITFTSNGSTNRVLGQISGAGGNLSILGGTLELGSANVYTGTTTINGAGVLRLLASGTIPNANGITINGTGNFNIRNTANWVFSGAITGEGTGSVNLNSGTNATLAGPISGVAGVTANSPGTDTTVSGIISGPASITVQGTVDANGLGAILRLSGENTYTGTTTVQRGTLVLAANNTLPASTGVILGNGTLDVGTFANSAAGLSLTSTATITLGTGGTIAFANSSDQDWAEGSLTITGNFVSGQSIRFGTSADGLNAGQLAQISSPGYTNFALNPSGFLTATTAGGYASWQAANSAAGPLDADHDNDGVRNGIEYFLGGSTSTTGFTALPGVVNGSITWVKADTYTGTYPANFVVETSTNLTGTWTPAELGTDPGQVEITGNNVKYTFPTGTSGFARLRVVGP